MRKRPNSLVPSASLVEYERDQSRTESSPVDGLFTATQRRVLSFLFGQPQRVFRYRELMELTGGGAGAVHRELLRLHSSGLVQVTRDGSRTLVQANPKSPIHDELVAIMQTTVGLREPLREAFGALRAMHALAFVIDPVAAGLGGKADDLAILVVTEFRALALAAAGSGSDLARQRLGVELFSLHFEPAHFKAPDERLRHLLAQPRFWVFGHEDKLRAITSGP